MNNFFSPKRFALYAAKIYSENSKKYLSYILLTVCLQVGIVSITAIGNPEAPKSIFRFIFSLPILALGVLFVFSEMKPFRSRHTAAIFNTTPASLFERYLLLVINATVVFTAIYIAIYSLTGIIAVKVFAYGDMATYFTKFVGMSYRVLDFFAYIAFAIFAGATNMRSHLLAFILVTVIAIPLTGSGIYLPWLIQSNILGDGLELSPYFNGIMATATEGDATVQYTTVPMFSKFFNAFTGRAYELHIWTIVFFVTGYFKLKERQVK